MANILPEILILIKESVKKLKVESWEKEKIVIRYPMIINFKITLLASKLLPTGMFFPLKLDDWIPEHIIIWFLGVKITLLRDQIKDFLIKAGSLIKF